MQGGLGALFSDLRRRGRNACLRFDARSLLCEAAERLVQAELCSSVGYCLGTAHGYVGSDEGAASLLQLLTSCDHSPCRWRALENPAAGHGGTALATTAYSLSLHFEERCHGGMLLIPHKSGALAQAWSSQLSELEGHLEELSEELGFLLYSMDREVALRRSEQLLRETSRMAQIGGWEFDPATGAGNWTEEVARIHDLEPGAPTNVNWGLSFFRGQNREIIERAVQEVVQHGTPYDLELEIVSAIGRPKWIRTTATAVYAYDQIVAVRGTFQDITQRKRTELALKESELHYRSLFENSISAIEHCRLIYDEEGRPVDWEFLGVNDAFRRMSGIDQPEGRRVREFFPNLLETDPTMFVHYDRAVRLGAQVEFETFMSHIQQWVWVRAYRNQPGHFVAIVEVISERKRAEEALRHSEARLRSMFEQMAVGVIQCCPKTGHLIDVNQKLCDIVGYTSDELVGRPAMILSHPDEHPIDIDYFAQLAGGLKNYVREKRYLRKDGSTVWVRLTVSQQFLPSPVYIAIVEDITDRRKAEAALRDSEERYRNLVDHLEDVVFTVAKDGRLTFVNRAIGRFGYQASDVIGKNVEFFLDDQGMATLRSLREHDWARFPKGWHEWKLRDEQGRMREVRVLLREVLKGDSYIGVVCDLTLQKDIEAQLRAAQKMEAIGRLAGGIAHDFNNILTVILSYSELALVNQEIPENVRTDLGEIHAAAHRAEGLTRQLLAFSRRQLLNPEVVEINSLLSGIEKMLVRLIGEDITLRVRGESSPMLVLADRGQLEQVIMNLVVNARDALPRGGSITISSGLSAVDDRRALALNISPGSYVELCVNDDGCGMDEATRVRIFEPFFTTKGLGQGTGLGLSTVYGIVNQSGGGIAVDSSVGRGSTFRIFLPHHMESCQPVAQVQAPAAPVIPHDDRGHETILVVEDETPLRNLIRRVLVKAGYEVLTASNGGEAFEVCRDHGVRVHLILTDVVMPGMSGGELIERLTPMCPNARVIFMSGYPDDALERYGMEGVEFLAKPFDWATLNLRIRDVLSKG